MFGSGVEIEVVIEGAGRGAEYIRRDVSSCCRMSNKLVTNE